MKESNEADKKLAEAKAEREHLRRSLLAMNGGNPNLYAAMGYNEGYDSLLCSLRAQDALIEELTPSGD